MSRYGRIDEIQNAISERLSYMILVFGRAVLIRRDFRFYYGYAHDGGNKEVSEFSKLFKEHYTRHGIKMHYCWVAERNLAAVSHYHFVFILDAARFSRLKDLIYFNKKAEAIWGSVLSCDARGLIDYCDHPYNGYPGKGHVFINRPASCTSQQDCLNQLQSNSAASRQAELRSIYLAKADTKDMTLSGVRLYGCSNKDHDDSST